MRARDKADWDVILLEQVELLYYQIYISLWLLVSIE